VTQFSLLQALEGLGEAPQGRLGEVLSIDSTTLTRSLRPLIRCGWVVASRGEDRRERLLRLSEEGRSYLKSIQPNWHRAQALLQEALGDERWAELNKFADRVLVAAEGA
jgi:DNA-binding MarR family transcriptional regulator